MSRRTNRNVALRRENARSQEMMMAHSQWEGQKQWHGMEEGKKKV